MSIFNTAFYIHLLLLKGREGQGPCVGDSGGPAYVRLGSGADSQWYLAGVVSALDPILLEICDSIG